MKVGIIGFGVMGQALAAGLAADGRAVDLFVYEKIETQRAAARERFNATVCATAGELAVASDVLILAVKPQSVDQAAAEFRPFVRASRIVSVVAGRTIASLQSGFGTAQVVRFMPNIAAKVTKALVAVSLPHDIRQEFRAQAFEIAESIGEPVELPEEQIAAATGISGSGIAYVFSFLHAMALGGVAAGIAYPTALNIALATATGAVELLRQSGDHPVALLSQVTSPAGTTIQGIRALEEGGFEAAVMAAVVAAAERARQLEG